MMISIKRALCTILTAVMLISASVPAAASSADINKIETQISQTQKEIDELQEKKYAARKEMQAIQAQIDALEKEAEMTLEKKQLLDEQMSYLLSEIDIAESLIVKYEEDIEQKRAQIEITRLEMEKQRELFVEFFRNEYEQGSTELKYLEILLTSRSISDLILNIQYIGSILDYEKYLLDSTEDLIITYESQQKDLLDAYGQQREIRGELRDNLLLAEELAAQTDRYLIQLASDSEKVLGMQQAKDREMEEISAEIEAELERVNALTVTKEDLIKAEEEKQRAEEERKKAAEEERKKAEAEASGTGSSSSSQIVKDGDWIWPVDYNKGKYTSPFGWRENPFDSSKTTWHNGIDLGIGAGNNIYAVEEGVVLISKYSSSWGNYVVVLHDNGMKTLYAHASKLLVSVGERVAQGTVIAKVGTTGLSTGNHLHFSVIGKDGEYKSPLTYYPTIAKSLRKYF